MDSNRAIIGVTEDSISFGKQHSQSLYNELVSNLIFNPRKNGVDRQVEVCLEILKQVAFVDIEMTIADALVITEDKAWDFTSALSVIGTYKAVID